MVICPLFSVDGWECEWNPRVGHTWSRGISRVRVRSNGAWKPGMAPVKHGNLLPARFMQVDRGLIDLARAALGFPRRMRGFGENTSSTGARPLKGWGNVTDGGEQGGQGIVLHPRYTRTTLAELDGTIERHPIAAFHFDTGMPLTRDDLGYSANYVLDGATVASNPPYQLAQFIGGGWPNPAVVTWQRIDVFHYCRAFNAAVAAWHAKRDPVGFFQLLACAHEVLRWLPLLPVTNGDSLYQRLRNLEASGHHGKMGVVRGRAHALRVVVEAARALQDLASRNEAQAATLATFEVWIRDAIDAEFLNQMSNGSYTSNTADEPSSEQGLPWSVIQPRAYMPGGTPDFSKGSFRLLSTSESEAPSWQLCFLTVALAEAAQVVPEKLDRVRVILRGHQRIFETCERVADRYHADKSGLPYWLVVSRDGAAVPVVEGIGLADTTYDADAYRAFSEVGL